MLNKLTVALRQHPWISSVAGMVLIIQVVELLLIIRMYGLFSPSFLQPYSIESFQDRLLFFTASIYGDLFLYSLLALSGFFIASFLKKNHQISAYHFFFSVTTISLAVLLAKYKALSYMSDTINFAIAKNIAGGSILSALSYVADEAGIIIILLVLAFVVHWIGYRWLKKHIKSTEFNEQKTFLLRNIILSLGIAFTCLIFITLAVQHYDNVRYGAIKKNSYKLIVSTLDMLTDVDQDGYGYFSFPADPAPFNPEINPGAVDIPGNGIDEDMLAGDFQLPSEDYGLDYSNIVPKFDYVFFIVLESAREEILTKKFNNHTVAPNIQAISQNGTIFKNTYSHTGFTISSLKAIFNGQLISNNESQSLFEILKETGYDINIFSGQAESFGGISKDTKMKSTASYFFDASTNIDKRVYANTDPNSLRLSEETVMHAVTDHISTLPKGRNFFYINLQAAHFPYHHPKMKNFLGIEPIPRSEISQKNQKWLEATYWNAIASADNAIGELVSYLKKLSIYNSSLIIITGDHGESLFDDGFLGHGHKINTQQLKIPFVTNARVSPITTPVGQTDMREIILDLINQDKTLALTKNKLKHKEAVFHIVGGISNPVQISQTYKNDRITFDFRTRKVLFEREGKWKSIDIVNTVPQHSIMFKKLIYKWEYLNYQQNR